MKEREDPFEVVPLGLRGEELLLLLLQRPLQQRQPVPTLVRFPPLKAQQRRRCGQDDPTEEDESDDDDDDDGWW